MTLTVAACGSDDEESDATSAATAAGAETTAGAGSTATTAGSAGTTAGGSATTARGTGTTAGGESTGSAGCPPIDASTDDEHGEGGGRFISDLDCALDKPLKAEGDPIKIGFMNLEGDPQGSFPEASVAAAAVVDFINTELGGLGADIQNGEPGRPIELEVCKMAVTPDDSQRCANELIAGEPDLILSGYNFFGNHFPIFAQADIPVIVGPPITIGDYTSPGVLSIGSGGGCLGAHTGLVYYATHQLEGRRVAVPWADTPPGVTCYYDLEAKPLDVLSGKVEGTSPDAGTIPDLVHIGVPIKPATPDTTAAVTQILDFDPDVIVYSAQQADCWNLVAGLGRLGWTPEQIPLVLSGACVDFEAAAAAGELANGIYFQTGGAGSLTTDPESIEDPHAKLEAETYQTKSVEYGLKPEQLSLNQSHTTFSNFLSIWERASRVAVDGGEVTGESIYEAFAATDAEHSFASTPLSCAKAPPPYLAACNSETTMSQWDGTKLVQVADRFSAAHLIAGTEIKPGP